MSRAVAALEKTGALAATGRGRARRFRSTPFGFAALVLNLLVLTEDPTINGTEFELKRTLVAMWNILVDRLVELPEEQLFDDSTEHFFDEVETVTIWDQPVVTKKLLRQALDVKRLVEAQRVRIEALK